MRQREKRAFIAPHAVEHVRQPEGEDEVNGIPRGFESTAAGRERPGSRG